MAPERRDGLFVRVLRGAGCVPIFKTNVPPMMMSIGGREAGGGAGWSLFAAHCVLSPSR